MVKSRPVVEWSGFLNGSDFELSQLDGIRKVLILNATFYSGDPNTGHSNNRNHLNNGQKSPVFKCSLFEWLSAIQTTIWITDHSMIGLLLTIWIPRGSVIQIYTVYTKNMFWMPNVISFKYWTQGSGLRPDLWNFGPVLTQLLKICTKHVTFYQLNTGN